VLGGPTFGSEQTGGTFEIRRFFFFPFFILYYFDEDKTNQDQWKILLFVAFCLLTIQSINFGLKGLRHLITLDVANNALKELPAEVSHLVYLNELNISHNQITILPGMLVVGVCRCIVIIIIVFCFFLFVFLLLLFLFVDCFFYPFL
jgi:hypothetical protein